MQSKAAYSKTSNQLGNHIHYLITYVKSFLFKWNFQKLTQVSKLLLPFF